MKNPEGLEALRKKISELERNLSAVSYLQFSYIQAILGLLDEKGITTADEFKASLEKHKKELADRFKDIEFLSVMNRNFPGKPGQSA